MLKDYKIVHISDLHFGDKHAKIYSHSNGVKLSGKSIIDIPISELILKQLRIESADTASTIVICSGDLATYDQPRDFTAASEFLYRFTNEYDIPHNHIILIPGNHDVHWKDYTLADEASMMNMFRTHFREFPNPTQDKDGPCYFFPDHRLMVYCLNSCLLCGAMQDIPALEDHLKKLAKDPKKTDEEVLMNLLRIDPGYIGSDQINDMARQIKMTFKEYNNDYQKKQYQEIILKVAVLHHHVAPIYSEFRRFPSVIDAVDLKNMLSDLGFHLLLHGHKHYPYYCKDSTFSDGSPTWLPIIASGSMGGELPANVPYSFNIFDIQNDDTSLPKVMLRRQRFSSSGTFIRDRKKPRGVPIELPKTQKAEFATGLDSLRRALSPHLPAAFIEKMLTTQQKYEAINTIEVEHYRMEYHLRLNAPRTGDHEANHRLTFINRGLTNLNHIVLSLSGSSNIPFVRLKNSLKKTAYYRVGKNRSWKKVAWIECLEDDYIKIIEFGFSGKGIAPGKSATIKMRYLWENTVEQSSSQWGLENWLFNNQLKKFTLMCRILGRGKFQKAIAYSAYYDKDEFVYKPAKVAEVLEPISKGKLVKWTLSPRDSQSLHFINCDYSYMD